MLEEFGKHFQQLSERSYLNEERKEGTERGERNICIGKIATKMVRVCHTYEDKSSQVMPAKKIC